MCLGYAPGLQAHKVVGLERRYILLTYGIERKTGKGLDIVYGSIRKDPLSSLGREKHAF